MSRWAESVLVALSSIVVAKVLQFLIKLAKKWKPLSEGPDVGLLGPSLPLHDTAATLYVMEDLARECTQTGVGSYRIYGYCIVLIADYETFKIYNKHRWEDGVQRPISLVALIESTSNPDYSPYSATEKKTWSSCKAAVGGLMSPINSNECFPPMLDKSSAYWKRVLSKFKGVEKKSLPIFEELIVLATSFMFDSTFGTDFGLSTTTSGDQFALEKDAFNCRNVGGDNARHLNPAWEYAYHMYEGFLDVAANVSSLKAQFASILPRPIRDFIAPFYHRKGVHEKRQLEIIEECLKNSTPSKKIDDCIRHLNNVGTQQSEAEHSMSVNFCIRAWLEGASGATALCIWTILDLAKRPKVQKRAREEVLAALKVTGGRLGDVEITDLKYVEACFLESTRLNPAFIMTRTSVEKPLDLPQGQIPVGSDVHVMCRPLLEKWGRDNGIKDWYKFRPERWFDQNFKNSFPTVLCGFGHRSCVGRYMAPKAVVAGVAGLLQATASFELDTSYPLKSTMEFLYYLPGFPHLLVELP